MMSSRSQIYYWKCDRPASLHGVVQGSMPAGSRDLQAALADALAQHFGSPAEQLRPGGGQGNHATFVAEIRGRDAFIRVEDGPECDDYFTVESHVLGAVRRIGVPAPEVLGFDATRRSVPFAWQVLERIPDVDLNQIYKAGRLDLPVVARKIGALIALWQQHTPRGFGPFRTSALVDSRELVGYHENYAAYFMLNLERHLRFLVDRGFLGETEADYIGDVIENHSDLLVLPTGCLVHKDLALWNVLGTESHVSAVIDWDDCISGDPMDDLSLLGCFHGGAAIRDALCGYASIRQLPRDHALRFWLHLLRNMIVKAVIRVGAGYFNLDNKFFLLGPHASGTDLRQFTLDRIRKAIRGLLGGENPESL